MVHPEAVKPPSGSQAAARPSQREGLLGWWVLPHSEPELGWGSTGADPGQPWPLGLTLRPQGRLSSPFRCPVPRVAYRTFHPPAGPPLPRGRGSREVCVHVLRQVSWANVDWEVGLPGPGPARHRRHQACAGTRCEPRLVPRGDESRVQCLSLAQAVEAAGPSTPPATAHPALTAALGILLRLLLGCSGLPPPRRRAGDAGSGENALIGLILTLAVAAECRFPCAGAGALAAAAAGGPVKATPLPLSFSSPPHGTFHCNGHLPGRGGREAQAHTGRILMLAPERKH